MQNSNRSPRIKHVSWGRLEIEGEAEPYKDAKLFPGGSCEWNWRETGTAHKRSEEHTSELQSQSNLVCRLLLEKKTASGPSPAPECRPTFPAAAPASTTPRTCSRFS